MNHSRKQEPEAARIKKEVAEVLWPQAVAEYVKLQKIHEDFRATVQKEIQTGVHRAVMNRIVFVFNHESANMLVKRIG